MKVNKIFFVFVIDLKDNFKRIRATCVVYCI